MPPAPPGSPVFGSPALPASPGSVPAVPPSASAPPLPIAPPAPFGAPPAFPLVPAAPLADPPVAPDEPPAEAPPFPVLPPVALVEPPVAVAPLAPALPPRAPVPLLPPLLPPLSSEPPQPTNSTAPNASALATKWAPSRLVAGIDERKVEALFRDMMTTFPVFENPDTSRARPRENAASGVPGWCDRLAFRAMVAVARVRIRVFRLR
jgi:hypothetical protein